VARTLIVNADDYGLAPAVSAGIRLAHLNGLVTSTTAMMNMAPAAEALRQAQAECPRLGLGVHLVLTAGRPVLPAQEVRSLVQLADGERFPPLATFMARRSDLDLAQVHAEWQAQIERFVAVTGQRPTHLDSHHHTSYLTPGLLRTMLDLAEAYGTPIRMPITTLDVVQAVVGKADSLPLIEQFLKDVRVVLAARPGQRHPDHFEPRFYGEQANAATLRGILAALPEGSTEIMCHPALEDPALDALTAYGSRARAKELATLTAAEVKAALPEGVRLVTFEGV
jgi:predicted glycoside hydrolase/deacetylase ChbG (UPF0249 family)